MKFKHYFLLFSMLAVLSGCAVSEKQGAYAKRTLKADVIRWKHIDQFEKIQSSFEQQNYQQASLLLNQLSEQLKLNSTELSYIDSYRGNLCFIDKDLDCLIREYEKILPRKARIPQQFYRDILQTLADAHYSLEHYPQAIWYAEQLRNASVYLADDADIFIGKAYYELNNYDAALAKVLPVLTAVNADGQLFQTDWVALLIDIYKELDQLEEASKFIDSIGTRFPKVKHRLRIAELYGELGRSDDMERIQQQLVDQGLAGYKDGRLVVWQSDGEPFPIYRPAPIYPREAVHRRLQEGSVDLMMDIDKSGKTKNIRITTASRKNIFDAAAVHAAAGYIFEPAIENGEVVEVKDHEIRISFQREASRK